MGLGIGMGRRGGGGKGGVDVDGKMQVQVQIVERLWKARRELAVGMFCFLFNREMELSGG